MILDLFMEGGLAKVTQSWRKTIEESDRRAFVPGGVGRGRFILYNGSWEGH